MTRKELETVANTDKTAVDKTIDNTKTAPPAGRAEENKHSLSHHHGTETAAPTGHAEENKLRQDSWKGWALYHPNKIAQRNGRTGNEGRVWGLFGTHLKRLASPTSSIPVLHSLPESSRESHSYP